jgi:hypothetical protein
MEMDPIQLVVLDVLLGLGVVGPLPLMMDPDDLQVVVGNESLGSDRNQVFDRFDRGVEDRQPDLVLRRLGGVVEAGGGLIAPDRTSRSQA